MRRASNSRWAVWGILWGVLWCGVSRGGEEKWDDINLATHWRVVGRVLNSNGELAAGVKVRGVESLRNERRETITDMTGEFTFVVPRKVITLLLEVHQEGTGEVAYQSAWQRSAIFNGTVSLEISLRPQREIAIQVVDSQAKPIEGATVAVLQRSYPVAESKTDREGIVRAKVSTDLSEMAFRAFKGGLGYDYLTFPPPRKESDKNVPPDTVILTLGGARAVGLKVKDCHGKPVSGVLLGMERISRRGKEGLPMSGRWVSMKEATDERGVATFDWIPLDLNQPVAVESLSEDFKVVSDANVSLLAGEREFPVMVVRKSALGGRVLSPEGLPVAQARLHLDGAGHSGVAITEDLTTDEEGRFEVPVPGEAIYALAAWKGDFAAQQLCVVMRDGTPIRNMELRMARGGLITGEMTQGPSGRPRPNAIFILSQNCGYVPDDLLPEALPGSLRRTHFSRRLAATDKNGIFRFVVSPGQYELTGASTTELPKRFEIRDQKEVRFQFHQEWEERPYRGKVVGPDEKPIGLARVSGLYFSQGKETVHLQMTTDRNGEFRGQRKSFPLWVHVTSEDGKLELIARVDDDAEESRFTLQPLGSARGRLLDAKGIPMEGQPIRYWLALPMHSNIQTRHSWLGGEVKTNAQGEFHVSGLTIGGDWHFSAEGLVSRVRPYWKTYLVEPAEIDLGVQYVSPPDVEM